VVGAAGVRQWLSCAGRGPLTLVVVPGLGADSAAWAPVLPGLRRLLRTCTYDRPGLGRSPARPGTTSALSAGQLAAELWAVLRAAGQTGPYLVLGHSFGGLVARAFVAAHHEAVRGLLLAEAVTPGDRLWGGSGSRPGTG
jgi:pimeloyl-ACP methyl ester carboxylesterase